jgi:DNA invertase Pin-like site-specific DNA recombinase
VRVGLYARVSTERQQERGTVASQLEALRAATEAAGDEIVEEFIDDGYSGARLDRPGLDQLRDAAEAGVLDGVLCLCADRLARAYAYQVLILEELERFGVAVRFLEGPALGDDPQATLLVQMQGVIAEYERAKIAERYRRGKLYRARAGEVFFWKMSYGHRRVVPDDGGPARIEVFEPEAQIVREIFRAYVDAGQSIRQIAHDLHDRGIPSPTRKPIWGTSTIGRLLHNEAYIGTVYYNRRETIDGNGARGRARKTRYRERPREEWIPISVPAIIDRDTFERVRQVSRDNSKWNPRGAEPGAWLLRGLIECGHCRVGCNCHKMRGRNGTFHRYYYCRNHDLLRAGRRTPALPRAQHPRQRARRIRLPTGPPGAARPAPTDRRRARHHHRHPTRRGRADRQPAQAPHGRPGGDRARAQPAARRLPGRAARPRRAHPPQRHAHRAPRPAGPRAANAHRPQRRTRHREPPPPRPGRLRRTRRRLTRRTRPQRPPAPAAPRRRDGPRPRLARRDPPQDPTRGQRRRRRRRAGDANHPAATVKRYAPAFPWC